MASKPSISEEKPNDYPAPRPQELSLLGRKISQFDNKYVEESIEKLPRLLMTSSDGPTVLQEGFRYNALHIAARAGNSMATQFIIATVNGKGFMRKLYPNDPIPTRNERTKYLTDLYLNTPDKGALETPLHFACKFNFYEVAKILLGHPLCDTTRRNRDLKTAEEIIGSRASKDKAKDANKIRQLFYETKIVPIWSDICCELAPVVGRPVDFRYLAEFTPKPFKNVYGDAVEELFGPVDMSCVPVTQLGSKRVVRAYAGPVDEDTATKFQTAVKGTAVISLDTSFHDSPKLCKTPTPAESLNLSVNGLSLADTNGHGQLTPTPKRRLVRKSIHEINYTPPRQTNSYIPPKTPEPENRQLFPDSVFVTPPRDWTPKKVSQLLSPRAFTPPNMLSDKLARLKDPEKGLEKVARKYAHEFGIPWTEYWRFLGDFADLSTEEGMILLEDHLFRMKEIQWQTKQKEENEINIVGPKLTPITNLSNAFDRLTLDSDPRPNEFKRNLFHEASDTFYDCETFNVFVNGTKASKEDFQAYHALPEDLIDLNINKFPLLIGWYNALKCSGDKRLKP